MTTYKLKNIGYSIGIIKEDIDTIDVRLKIVTTGDYTDMSGTPVKITKDILHNIANKYKEDAMKTWQDDHSTTSSISDSIDNFDNRNAPMMKDHDTSSVDGITGHLIGLLEVLPLGQKDRYGLFGTVRIKGQDNKQKVKLKTYRNISIQFHPETFEFVEVSWVPKGADSSAVSMLGEFRADGDNITNLHGNNIIYNKFLTLQHVCDTIRLKDELILKLDNQIKVDKYLVALCKRRKLSKYEANLLKNRVSDQPNALGIIKIVDELMEPRLPKLKFINGESPEGTKILAHLGFNQHKENNMTDQTVVSADPLTNYFLQQEAQESGNVAMKAGMDEEVPLGKKELAKHRKYLSEKMAEHYEKDEKELAKKYREKLAKFEEDCEMGKLSALSEYDIDEESSKSEEVKKKEQELAKLKDDLAVALSEKEKLAADIIRLQAVQPQSVSKTPEEQLNILMQAFKSIAQPQSIGAA